MDAGFSLHNTGSLRNRVLAPEVFWHVIEPLSEEGMHVLVCVPLFSAWVHRDIGTLVHEVFQITHSMLMEASLPDIALEASPDRKRKAALDALDTAFDGLIGRRGEQHVDVIGHDNEAVQ